MRRGFIWKLGANLSFTQKFYEKVVEVLGEGAPFEHLPLPAGYPCEELLVLKCLEKGQRDRFLEEFSFPRGPLRNFACTCSYFVVSTNAPRSALLGTGACLPLMSQVVVLHVFVHPSRLHSPAVVVDFWPPVV